MEVFRVCLSGTHFKNNAHVKSIAVSFREVWEEEGEIVTGPAIFYTLERDGDACLNEVIAPKRSHLFCVDVFFGGVLKGWPGVNHVSRGYFVADTEGMPLKVIDAASVYLMQGTLSGRSRATRSAVDRVAAYEQEMTRARKAEKTLWDGEISKRRAGSALRGEEDMATRCHIYSALGPAPRLPQQFFFDTLPASGIPEVWAFLERCAQAVTDTTLSGAGEKWAAEQSDDDYQWLPRLLCAYCHAVSYYADSTVQMPDTDDIFELPFLNRSGDCEDMSAAACSVMCAIRGAVPAGISLSQTLARLRRVALCYEPHVALVTINGEDSRSFAHLTVMLLKVSEETTMPPSLLVEGTNMHACTEMNPALNKKTLSSNFYKQCDRFLGQGPTCEQLLYELPTSHDTPAANKSINFAVQGRSDGSDTWFHNVIEVISRDAQYLVIDDRGDIGMGLADVMAHPFPTQLLARFIKRQLPAKVTQVRPVSRHPNSKDAPWMTDFAAAVGLSKESDLCEKYIASLPSSPPPGTSAFFTLVIGYWCICANLEDVKTTVERLVSKKSSMWVAVHDVDLVSAAPNGVRRVSFMFALPRNHHHEEPEVLLQKTIKEVQREVVTSTSPLNVASRTTMSHNLCRYQSQRPTPEFGAVLAVRRGTGVGLAKENAERAPLEDVAVPESVADSVRATLSEAVATDPTPPTITVHDAVDVIRAAPPTQKWPAPSRVKSAHIRKAPYKPAATSPPPLETVVRVGNMFMAEGIHAYLTGSCDSKNVVKRIAEEAPPNTEELLQALVTNIEKAHATSIAQSWTRRSRFMSLLGEVLAEEVHDGLHLYEEPLMAQSTMTYDTMVSLRTRTLAIFNKDAVDKAEAYAREEEAMSAAQKEEEEEEFLRIFKHEPDVPKTVRDVMQQMARSNASTLQKLLPFLADSWLENPTTVEGINVIGDLLLTAARSQWPPAAIARRIVELMEINTHALAYCIAFMSINVITASPPLPYVQNRMWYYRIMRLTAFVVARHSMLKPFTYLTTVLNGLLHATIFGNITEPRLALRNMAKAIITDQDTDSAKNRLDDLLGRNPEAALFVLDALLTEVPNPYAMDPRKLHAFSLWLTQAAHTYLHKAEDSTMYNIVTENLAAMKSHANNTTMTFAASMSPSSALPPFEPPPHNVSDALMSEPAVREAIGVVNSHINPNASFDNSGSFQERITNAIRAVPAAATAIFHAIVARVHALHDYAKVLAHSAADHVRKWVADFNKSKFAQWSKRVLSSMWKSFEPIFRKIQAGVHEAWEGFLAMETAVKEAIAKMDEWMKNLEKADQLDML